MMYSVRFLPRNLGVRIGKKAPLRRTLIFRFLTSPFFLSTASFPPGLLRPRRGVHNAQ